MNTDSRRDKQDEPDRFDIFSMEEAEQAARAALECGRDEPADFVRMLLTLRDASKDARMTDALDFLIEGAFSCSISFSLARKRYVEALREVRNPDEESRADWRDSPPPKDHAAEGDRQHFSNVGNLVADIIEDERLPESVRKRLIEAANEAMNDLNEGIEINSGWLRQYFADACMRLRRKADTEGGPR